MSEYPAYWKHPEHAPWGLTQYQDFSFSNSFNSTCTLPDFWDDDGSTVEVQQTGCYASEFDQYGDMEAFGVHPDCAFTLFFSLGIRF